MGPNDPDVLRARVATACRVVGRMGLTRALRGHISARIPGTGRIFVRARGPAESGVRYTSDDEVVEVDLDGKPVAGMPEGLRSPSEIYIHTEIYRERPGINAVLHMHPPTVVLFTVVGIPIAGIAMLLYLATLYPSLAFTAAWAGHGLLSLIPRPVPPAPDQWGVVLGVVVLAMLFAVPYAGWAIHLLALFVGFGALWSTVWRAV